MSRIIVKNLPPKATEDAIRKHFEGKGNITDVRIMLKRDGSSRRFAFVGFKTDKQAEAASDYFNGSFMNTSRLEVQLAKSLGDSSLVSKRERQQRKRRSDNEPLDDKDSKRSKSTGEDKDAKLKEFLEVMKPQRDTALWANDNGVTGEQLRSNGLVSSSNGSHDVKNEDSDGDESDVVDMAAQLKSDEQEDAVKTTDVGQSEEVWVPGSVADRHSDESEKVEPEGEEKSDLDWLRERQSRIKENGEKPEPLPLPVYEQESKAVENKAEPAEVDANGTLIGETSRLFLRNLSYTVTQDELRELFSQFGTLKEVHVPIDPKTDRAKGMAYIEFDSPDAALKSYRTLDGSSYQGRLLHILGAQPKRKVGLDEFDLANLPLKKRQQLKRKMQAARAQFSWNSLYLNKDAVLETVARKLGVTKSQMLDPHSSNMAVKQALAESTVLESIQTYFKSKGVDLAKLDNSKELTDNIILVKNLPYGTSVEELQHIFGEFGDIIRILMPPDGGIAIVQFALASSGRAAFTKVAFKRLGESIIYLQKAPSGLLDETYGGQLDGAKSLPSETPKSAKSASDVLLPEATGEEEDSLDSRSSVFIKNINFTTTLESLARLFRPIPGFLGVQIKMKSDPKHPNKQMSMGYGFAEFRTLEFAKTAIAALDGSVLDNHKLQLKLSERGADSATSKKGKSSLVSSKIIIKNIPFEATKKDITDLFSSFGKLRSVRLPKKINNQTRGFSFAEFATPKEAEHAMASLSGAHLLGRRLVMQYAQADAEDPEAEIARMEAKVSGQVIAEHLSTHRVLGKQKGFDMDSARDEGME